MNDEFLRWSLFLRLVNVWCNLHLTNTLNRVITFSQNYNIAVQTHSFHLLKPNSLIMKTLKLLFLLPLSILSLSMSAQIDDLMRNKDITWVAETYTDFVFDESVEGKLGENIPNSVIVLKFLNKKQEDMDERTAINEWLSEAVESGRLTIYEDDNCTKPCSMHAVLGADTLIAIDPNTYEQRMIVREKNIRNYNVSLFRAKQIVFYDAKKAQFGIRTIAIAPIYINRYYEGENIVSEKSVPLLWFKAKDITEQRRLTSRYITWAKQLNFRNGIALDSAKVLKISNEHKPIQHLLEAFETKPRISFYKMETPTLSWKIDFAERQKAFISADTISTVDPLTNEIKFKVVFERIKYKDVNHLKFIQNWYWDDKKKRFEIYLMATAPLRDIRNDGDGSLMYRLPLFYRKMD